MNISSNALNALLIDWAFDASVVQSFESVLSGTNLELQQSQQLRKLLLGSNPSLLEASEVALSSELARTWTLLGLNETASMCPMVSVGINTYSHMSLAADLSAASSTSEAIVTLLSMSTEMDEESYVNSAGTAGAMI